MLPRSTTSASVSAWRRCSCWPMCRDCQSRGAARDRAGRPCTALSVDSGAANSGLSRDVLLVDATGTILGHEIIALTPPPKSRIPNETVIEYTLSLRTEHQQ
jgi:hypothetical protein